MDTQDAEDTECEVLDEPLQVLLKRIYYSARDGMAIALYSLLYDKSNKDVSDFLINQVTYICCHLSPSLLITR